MPKTPDLSAWTYNALAEKLQNASPKHTTEFYYATHAAFVGENCIAIWHHDTIIAYLYADGSLALHRHGFQTTTTKRRMDYLMQANLHRRIVTVKRRWKVYTPSDGSYEDFLDGHVYANVDSATDYGPDYDRHRGNA